MADEKKHSMKVIGGRNLPDHWERFDRLQQMGDTVRGPFGPPRGVYRFKSFEEFNEWKWHQQINHPARPGRKTS